MNKYKHSSDEAKNRQNHICKGVGVYSPFYIKTLFKQRGIKPRKSLGQNFVINKSVIDRIIEAADLKPNDTVLEIGPGIGTLTVELAKKVQKVIAVEKDGTLCNILRDALRENNIDNVAIIEGDALKIQITKSKFQIKSEIQNSKNWKLPAPLFWQTPRGRGEIACPALSARKGGGNWKLVSNIPYYITQPIIRLFLESEGPPQEIILLAQKEVARRICAKPPKMNLLAVSVQFYAKPKIITYVSQNNFWPKPKVDSAIIKITPTNMNSKLIRTEKFFKAARAGFSAPRKMLINNLTAKLEIPKEKLNKIFNQITIDRKARAENLSLNDWRALAQIIK